MQALKRRNIRFIVAPYEADAQMAYLALNGLADGVLTEDSDLLCYGCPTVRQTRRAGQGRGGPALLSTSAGGAILACSACAVRKAGRH